mmetsp:Transcript_20951/g.51197  ORF Transcript_20951/g.51197 Transcript_20951/m.51197 type:complete len:322 (-) Transcript_20951:180-1145(-)
MGPLRRSLILGIVITIALMPRKAESVCWSKIPNGSQVRKIFLKMLTKDTQVAFDFLSERVAEQNEWFGVHGREFFEGNVTQWASRRGCNKTLRKVLRGYLKTESRLNSLLERTELTLLPAQSSRLSTEQCTGLCRQATVAFCVVAPAFVLGPLGRYVLSRSCFVTLAGGCPLICDDLGDGATNGKIGRLLAKDILDSTTCSSKKCESCEWFDYGACECRGLESEPFDIPEPDEVCTFCGCSGDCQFCPATAGHLDRRRACSSKNKLDAFLRQRCIGLCEGDAFRTCINSVQDRVESSGLLSKCTNGPAVCYNCQGQAEFCG